MTSPCDVRGARVPWIGEPLQADAIGIKNTFAGRSLTFGFVKEDEGSVYSSRIRPAVSAGRFGARGARAMELVCRDDAWEKRDGRRTWHPDHRLQRLHTG